MSYLDGRGRRTLLRGVGCVLSLTIDVPVQTIYWMDPYHGPGVGYCPLNNCTKVPTAVGPLCLFFEVASRLSSSGVPSHDFYRNFCSAYSAATVVIFGTLK